MRSRVVIYDLVGEESGGVHVTVRNDFVPSVEVLKIVTSSFNRINAPLTIDGQLIQDGITEVN